MRSLLKIFSKADNVPQSPPPQSLMRPRSPVMGVEPPRLEAYSYQGTPVPAAGMPSIYLQMTGAYAVQGTQQYPGLQQIAETQHFPGTQEFRYQNVNVAMFDQVEQSRPDTAPNPTVPLNTQPVRPDPNTHYSLPPTTDQTIPIAAILPNPAESSGDTDSDTDTSQGLPEQPRLRTSIQPPTKILVTPTTDTFTKPTCSLNLICYRPGSQGCVRRQMQVARKSHVQPQEKVPQQNAGLITSDEQFFLALSREYNQHICGFWRGLVSLKTLRQIRLLSYTGASRPEIVPLDEFTLQEIFHAYKHPSSITTDEAWIDWVFRLRQQDRRHALEFVEGWSGFRIALIGSVPWIAATIMGIVWVSRGGDAQTAFTVAGFILTVGNSLLALLAIVSKIET
ncbi:Nn.00g053580.m01.CDS01 [Neocucurbitaria sp. VM-36]